MDIRSYADVLKFAIQMQIEYEKEELEKPCANEDYLDGVITGLRIALEKIKASEFLME